jgi:hypothetical protein
MTPRQPELPLDPDESPRGPKFLAVVSNRRDLNAAALVHWHWQRAGTIEHIYRVFKDELGAGVMRSHVFATNAAWLRIDVVTANLLTAPKHIALPARSSLHQRQLVVDASASPERLATVTHARSTLLALLLQKLVRR